MSRKCIQLFILTTILPYLVGCASIECRKNGYRSVHSRKYYYCGVKKDLEDSKQPEEYFTTGKLFYLIPMFDLPFSLVGDSILLPFDIVNKRRGGS